MGAVAAGRWRRWWWRRWCRWWWWRQWCRRRRRKTRVSLLWARFCGRAEMMGIHRHTQCFGNIWLLFGVLFSICVFVGTPKIDKYLAFYSCYKKKRIHKYKSGHFVCVSVYQSRQITFLATQMHKRWLRRKKTFAQKKNCLLCICVLVYRGKEITALVRCTIL